MNKPQDTFYLVVFAQDTDMQQRIGKILYHSEFDISYFISEKEFIRYLRMQPAPHCLIMHFSSEKQNSYWTILEKVKKHSYWQHVPILVISQKMDNHCLEKLKQYNISQCVLEPFTDNTLFNTLLKSMRLEVVKETSSSPKKSNT